MLGGYKVVGRLQLGYLLHNAVKMSRRCFLQTRQLIRCLAQLRYRYLCQRFADHVLALISFSRVKQPLEELIRFALIIVYERKDLSLRHDDKPRDKFRVYAKQFFYTCCNRLIAPAGFFAVDC